MYFLGLNFPSLVINMLYKTAGWGGCLQPDGCSSQSGQRSSCGDKKVLEYSYLRKDGMITLQSGKWPARTRYRWPSRAHVPLGIRTLACHIFYTLHRFKHTSIISGLGHVTGWVPLSEYINKGDNWLADCATVNTARWKWCDKVVRVVICNWCDSTHCNEEPLSAAIRGQTVKERNPTAPISR